MIHPEGIEVGIKCLDRDELYAEYSRPGDDSTNDGSSKALERFIEVAPGERFSVLVKMNPNFNPRNAPGIKIKTIIDQGTCNSWRYKTMVQMKDKNYEQHTAKQVVGGKDMYAEFSFGALDLEDDSIHDEDEEDKADRFSEEHGRIRVVVQRGFKQVKTIKSPRSVLATPEATPGPDSTRPAAATKTSVKIFKMKGITQSVRPVVAGARLAKPPQAGDRIGKFAPVTGVGKDELIFTFRYRSNATLQKLGIISLFNGNDIHGRQATSTPRRKAELAPLDPPIKRRKVDENIQAIDRTPASSCGQTVNQHFVGHPIASSHIGTSSTRSQAPNSSTINEAAVKEIEVLDLTGDD